MTTRAKKPANKIVRVAVYLRQSLDAKDDRKAVERQLDACTRWIAERSTPTRTYVLDRVYEDNDTSASNRRVQRKGWTAMLDAALAGEFDMILSYHLDRLTRSIRDLLPLLDLATQHNIGTTTVSGDLDLATDGGRGYAGMLAVMAQGEVDRKSARQIAANEQRAEQGRPSRAAHRALGYESDGVTIRQSEALHVRRAFTALLAGASLGSIARELNEAGARTTRGKLFTAGAVRQVLINPRYAGILTRHDVEIGKGKWKRLVPESTYRAAASLLSDPSRRINHSSGERRRLLTGIGLCGVCNDGTTVISGSRGAGQPIYKCNARTSNGGHVAHLSRKLGVVEDAVEAAVLDLLRRPDARMLLVDKRAPDLGALDKQRVELVAEQSKDMADMKAGRITRKQLHEANADTNRRIAKIDAQMTHRSRERVLGELVRASEPEPIWAAMSLERKQAALTALGTWTIERGQSGGNQARARHSTLADVHVTWSPAPGITV
jgi:site-specific DNA recombinase